MKNKKEINSFLNLSDSFFILDAILNRSYILDEKKMSSITQDEIVDMTGIYKLKVNIIINDFIDKKYIIKQKSGLYEIPETTVKLFNRINKIKKELEDFSNSCNPQLDQDTLKS